MATSQKSKQQAHDELRQKILNEGQYHPEQPRGMLEGTAGDILAFMLNNSGLTQAEFGKMIGSQWQTCLEKLDTFDLIIKVLRALGYKLVAIPYANYMLSKTESYQFIRQEDKLTSLDEVEHELVNFKPMSMAELKQYGVEFVKQTLRQETIYKRSLDEEAITVSGLIRSTENWNFRPISYSVPAQKKRKVGRPINPESERQLRLKQGATYVKKTDARQIKLNELVKEALGTSGKGRPPKNAQRKEQTSDEE